MRLLGGCCKEKMQGFGSASAGTQAVISTKLPIPSEGLYELKESCLLASDVVVEGNQTLAIVGKGLPQSIAEAMAGTLP